VSEKRLSTPRADPGTAKSIQNKKRKNAHRREEALDADTRIPRDQRRRTKGTQIPPTSRQEAHKAWAATVEIAQEDTESSSLPHATAHILYALGVTAL
jgi:hypothetical protein